MISLPVFDIGCDPVLIKLDYLADQSFHLVLFTLRQIVLFVLGIQGQGKEGSGFVVEIVNDSEAAALSLVFPGPTYLSDAAGSGNFRPCFRVAGQKGDGRRDFLADMVASMALDGNAFVRLVRFGGEIVSCEVLPPSLVVVSDDGSDPAAPKLRYSYLGKDYGPTDIVHCKFLNVPGRLRGLGPISAAREEVEGAKMARDYKARFYTDSSNLKGYLKTEQKVTPEYKLIKKGEC